MVCRTVAAALCNFIKKQSLTQITKVRTCATESWNHQPGLIGPENWNKFFPAANGKFQSPIALASGVPEKTCPLNISGYKKPRVLTAYNLGPIVAFKTDSVKKGSATPCYISGVHDWTEEYTFDHFHMHWGSTSDHGSEHSIDGKFFPMELHVVHTLANLTLPQASNVAKGIAVLGFMYEISDEDNKHYLPLVEALKSITYKDQDKVVGNGNSVTLLDLLPENLKDGYFWYSGSLTTPPCSEVVHWMVFSKPIPISEKQMEVFRTLQRCEGADCVEPMSDNYRPIQPTNERPVYKSYTVTYQD